jgi:MFS family permease
VKQHFYNSWVAPLRSPKRLRIFGAQFFSAIATGFLTVFLTLDMVRFGADGLIAYTVMRFGVAGFVVFPFLTALYLGAPRRWFQAAVVSIQCLALVPLFVPAIAHAPVWVGLCMGLSSGAYWQAFHLAMTAHTSSTGRGQEISFSQIMCTSGGAIGVLLAGVAAMAGLPLYLAGIALMVQLLASLLFCAMTPRAHIQPELSDEGTISRGYLRAEIWQDRQRLVLTLSESVYTLLADILRPAWLKLAGVAALSVGVVSALIIVIQAFATPWVNALHQRRDGSEMRWGSLLLTAGWLPWTVVLNTGLLFVSVPLWAAGFMMVQTGLGSQWYRDRSAMAILAREMILTVMRLSTGFIAIPLLFAHPSMFALLIVAAGLILGLASCCRWQKSYR